MPLVTRQPFPYQQTSCSSRPSIHSWSSPVNPFLTIKGRSRSSHSIPDHQRYSVPRSILHTCPWPSPKFDGDRRRKPMIKPPVGGIRPSWNPAEDEHQSTVNPSLLGSSWIIHWVPAWTSGLFPRLLSHLSSYYFTLSLLESWRSWYI